jgi:hypothetical protein
MNNPNDLCARCECKRSKHCKGEQTHGNYKEDSRMVPLKWRKDAVVCHTRHCLEPMCSCVDFVERPENEHQAA